MGMNVHQPPLETRSHVLDPAPTVPVSTLDRVDHDATRFEDCGVLLARLFATARRRISDDHDERPVPV